VLQYVTQLEKQLPGKAEMSALLSDINQAGLGRSLQFDIPPGQMVVRSITPSCRFRSGSPANTTTSVISRRWPRAS
jgi:hypothetical protein